MYTVHAFGRMAADGVRMDAYARAIARVVKPGSVVVDIGAGTGIFSLLAARAGAKRVHAVDGNASVLLVPELAAANGFSDRIEVHHAMSFDVELPERADVIVSDLRGSFPLYESHLETLADAKERWLAPSGTLLPSHDDLFVALVESEASWRVLEEGWSGLTRHGFVADAARIATLNAIYGDASAPIMASDCLTRGHQWGELAYGTMPGGSIDATVSLPVVRGGLAHGFAIWFEATIHDDIRMSSAPGQNVVYRRMFLPLLEPVQVAAGTDVSVTLRVDKEGTRWGWDTEVRDTQGASRRFRQSTFLGTPTSPETLLRESSSFAPVLSDKGKNVQRVLSQMDGKRTLVDLANDLGTLQPRAPKEKNLDEVRALARRYAR